MILLVLVACVALALLAITAFDLIQRRHSIWRIYPIIGHLRWVMEGIRPELQQYFVEPDRTGEPFDHDTRALVYMRAKNIADDQPFGTELNVYADGHEWFDQSLAPKAGTVVDFVIVDGSEGGTGAAPLEFTDHVGTPLTEGLVFVHNALVGSGLRDRVKVGCSGKIASGFSIAARPAQGADYTNSARAMMFALGCIQAQRCHTNTCPVGVATQDRRRTRGLVVADKAERVYHFHRRTIDSANALIAAMGLDSPAQLGPHLLHRRLDPTTVRTYDQLYRYLEPGELLVDPPDDWAHLWAAARPDRFG